MRISTLIVLSTLILAGGCTIAGCRQPVETASVAGHRRQLVSSPSAVPETTNTLEPVSTDTATPSPTMTSTPTITTSPTSVQNATRTATPTFTAKLVPHVLRDVGALNLRAGPGTIYSVITSLAGGVQLTVEGRNEAGDWLLVEQDKWLGWVSANYVGNVPDSLSTLTTPPPPTAISTLPLPTATSEPTLEATIPPTPAQHSTIILDPDTTWPVRAERIVGWGYELVDASERWDWVLQRDVYGVVAHEFWGEQLYGPHPNGIRITLIDLVWDVNSPTPLAPLPLFADDRGLFEGFGDGAGSMIYVGCAIALHHHFDPQECFIAIDSAGGHLTDIVVAATITAQHNNIAGYFARTPDFSQPPFHLLGEAYRDGDQWRWRNPFLEVVPTS